MELRETEQIDTRTTEFQNLYSPATLLGVYAGALRTAADGRLILARGIYQHSGSTKEYAGYYYDSIKGVDDNGFIKARVPSLMRSRLRNNAIYVFRGYMEKRVGFSSIDLTFTVDAISEQEDRQVPEEDMKRFDLIQKKIATGFRDFESLVRNKLYRKEKLRIANLYGNSAIVHKDFEKGIGAAASVYSITEQRCNFASRSDIVRMLGCLEKESYDVVALVRGGGEGGLEIFNDPELGNAVAGYGPLLVTALGHTVNETLIDKLADRKFALPHDYGVSLRQWSDDVAEEQARSKSHFIEQVKTDLTKTFSGQISTLQQQLQVRNKEFEKLSVQLDSQTEKFSVLNRKILWYVFAALVAGLLAGLLAGLFSAR